MQIVLKARADDLKLQRHLQKLLPVPKPLRVFDEQLPNAIDGQIVNMERRPLVNVDLQDALDNDLLVL